MSAILGAVHFNGSQLNIEVLRVAANCMSLRGPDAQGFWSDNSYGVALAHQALWSTPQAMHEVQPLVDPEASLCLVFDGRLDDRKQLAVSLNSLGYPPRQDTDSELVLRAYQCWGEGCAARLNGDFAFAVWDGKLRKLYLARDIFGCRPLYFFQPQNGVFAFASTTYALLCVPNVPKRINEARIADFLVPGLEGVNKTCTFYQNIQRLQPATWMSVDAAGHKIHQYWKAEGNPMIRLANDAEYEEAFLELFEKAVQNCMRGEESVGSMLSGGMDSGSIVAVARELAFKLGGVHLRTYSALDDELVACRESRAVREVLKLDKLHSTTICPSALDGLEPDLGTLTWSLEEPFDYHMIVPRSMYLLARRDGLRTVLDGIDGDSILSEGTFIARLLRTGHWLKAWREAAGQNRFYFGNYPPFPVLFRSMRTAFGPKWLRMALRPLRLRQMVEHEIRDSAIRPDFAESVQLHERIESLVNHFWRRDPLDRAADMAGIVEHTYITSGIERYERVAASCGLESRHPFLFRPLVEFAVRLPDEQRIRDGWPKHILRRVMRNKLPHAFVRYGKAHLGWSMTRAYLTRLKPTLAERLRADADILLQYIRKEELDRLVEKACSLGPMDAISMYRAYEVCHLANWLRQQTQTRF